MLKRTALILSSGLLKLTLFSLALAAAGWMTFGTPEKFKQAAGESNLYSNAVSGILEAAKEDAQEQGAELPLDQPEVEQAIKDALPPQLLQESGESFINGLYGWLRGDTEQPEFSIDLTEAKQRFASGIGNYAERRYEELPPCTFAQLQALDADVDPLEVECRVPGLSASTVRQRAENELLNSDGFLKDPLFTAEDLPKDDQGKTITENLAGAPGVFTGFRLLPWIFGVLSLILAAGVLFFSENIKRGLKSLGVTLLGTGIFLAVGSLLFGFLFSRINQPGNNAAEDSGFQDSLATTARLLAGDYNAVLMRFYVAYIVLGTGILLVLWYKNRGTGAPVAKTKK